MAVLRLFAQAREVAGTSRIELPGRTVGEILDAARLRFGDGFAVIVAGSRVWVNGAPATESDPVDQGDEVAVIPPVSGG